MGMRGKPRAEHRTVNGEPGKHCPGCREPRKLAEFGTKRAAWDGKTPRCRECNAASTTRRTNEAIRDMRRRRLAGTEGR